MSQELVEYSFQESNQRTIVMVPGYTGGLEVSAIQEIVKHLVSCGNINVFGVPMSYAKDNLDVFDASQRRLVSCLSQIVSKVSGTDIVLVAKSLGGSLSLFNHLSLRISRMILLGCPVILGWPQRISLLKVDNPVIPDYKKEWNDALLTLSVPTLILSGELDNLTDNQFLTKVTKLNKNIQLTIVENANHSLEDMTTNRQRVTDYMALIKEFSGLPT